MKYAPEILFAVAVSAFLAYAVSWHGPSHRTPLTNVARFQLDAYLNYANASKRKHGEYPKQIPLTTDPWDSLYEYTLVDNAPRVCSLGPDRVAKTPDDICLK
jgi:hypothetical protein